MCPVKRLPFWCAILLIFTIRCSNGSPPRILNLHRIRRAADITTTLDPPSLTPTTLTLTTSAPPMSTLPSTMMSSPKTTVSSMVEDGGPNVDCTTVDASSLKKMCPDNNTCPLDDENMEKCCRCFSTCCPMENSASSSSEETMAGMSTVKPGKDIGSRVKDAVNSAEGWLKNAGENIKNSWNKAKDSISNAASDVSEKVKKGINSVSNRVRNATNNSNNNSNSDCREKDGKCTTIMTPIPGGTTDPDSSEGTPVPGFQKSKRDLNGRSSYYSPYSSNRGLYDNRYNTGSSYGSRDSDNSDSREYSWSKTTTTTRDSNNRRYRRAGGSPRNSKTGNNSTSSPPSSEKASGSGRNARSINSGIAFTEYPSNSGGENCSGPANSNYRQNRESPSNVNFRENNAYSSRSNAGGQQYPSSPSESSAGNMIRRSRRGVTTSTEKVQLNLTTVNAPNRRNKREANSNHGRNSNQQGSSSDSNSDTSNEESNEDSEDSEEEYNDYRNGENNHKNGKGDDSNYSISVKVLGPRGSNETHYSFSSTGKGVDHDHDHRFEKHESGGHGHKGGGEHHQTHSEGTTHTSFTSSMNSRENFDSSTGQSSLLCPDGGVISGPQSNNNGRMCCVNGNKEHGETHHSSDAYNNNNGNSNGRGHNNVGWNNDRYSGGGAGRQSHDFSNRGHIRSTDAKSDHRFEPHVSYSSGIDVTHYPILSTRQVSGLAPQSSMFRTGQGRSYNNNNNDMNSNQNRHFSHPNHNQNHQNNDYYDQYDNQNGDNMNGWNSYSDTGGNNRQNGQDSDYGNYASQSNSYGYNSGSSSNWGNMNSESSGSSSSGSSTSSSSSNNNNGNNMAYGKPGQCKPLSNGVHCLNLHPDTSQCLYDKDCSGSKKCCFYGCIPNKNVGRCEQPEDDYEDEYYDEQDYGHHHHEGYPHQHHHHPHPHNHGY